MKYFTDILMPVVTILAVFTSFFFGFLLLNDSSKERCYVPLEEVNRYQYVRSDQQDYEIKIIELKREISRQTRELRELREVIFMIENDFSYAEEALSFADNDRDRANIMIGFYEAIRQYFSD